MEELGKDNEKQLVTFQIEDENGPASNAKYHQIRLQITETVHSLELLNYLSSSWASSLLESREEIIQAPNILVGLDFSRLQPPLSPSARIVTWNRSVASSGRVDLGGELQGLQQFFVSVRLVITRISAIMQVNNMVFFFNAGGHLGGVMIASPPDMDRTASTWSNSSGECLSMLLTLCEEAKQWLSFECQDLSMVWQVETTVGTLPSCRPSRPGWKKCKYSWLTREKA